jgi:DtxR family transcriptional regulator, Mn-dependent transcriptional regulator
MSNALSASLEDYLEAIFHLSASDEGARAKDIAHRLQVRSPSVTGALRALAQRGLVNYAPYDAITLTSEGRSAATEVVRKHEVFRDFLVNVLSVERSEAESAACDMEHAIPKSILERLVQFAEFVEMCPRGGQKWIAGFAYYCGHGGNHENCEKCIGLSLEAVRARQAAEENRDTQVVSLRDLKPGDRARIVRVRNTGALSKRVREMGMVPGTLVEIERVAPLGDPIDIKLRGYHLSLRKSETGAIDVEPV